MDGSPTGSVDPGAAAVAMQRRLQDALAASIVDKGLAATTIADIARHACTSKRTFYEHFTDKEDCFFALYRRQGEELIAAVEQALSPASAPAALQIQEAVQAFVTQLTEDKAMGRTHLGEITMLGPRGVAVRREVVDRHAESLRALTDRAREAGSAARRLTHLEAVCVVGGLAEIAERALEPDGSSTREELVDEASRFAQAVILADRRQ